MAVQYIVKSMLFRILVRPFDIMDAINGGVQHERGV